jgi:hypothetical protein
MAEANMEIPLDHDYPSLDHIIIWLDLHIGKPGECKRLKKAFASHLDPRSQTYTRLTDQDFDNLLRTGDIVPVHFAGIPFHLLAFDNPYKCYEAFERHRDKHIYFITSGSMGEHIVPVLVAHHRELFVDPITQNPYHSIYIFCGNIGYHYNWLYDVIDYAQAFTHEADLLARMTRDVADYCVEQGERHLRNALLRYQWSKKVFEQYKKLGENCTKEMRNVEQRTAEIESILTPQISNPHVIENNLIDNEVNDDEQPSQVVN